MRTYYRGPDALVTLERFVWETTPSRTFAVHALDDVVLVRCNVPAGPSRSAAPAALAMTVLAGAGFVLAGPVVGAAVGLFVVLAGAAALVGHSRRTVREWQVRATYFGSPVTVYASTDERVFNQVTRALRRAREDGRRPAPRTRRGLTAA